MVKESTLEDLREARQRTNGKLGEFSWDLMKASGFATVWRLETSRRQSALDSQERSNTQVHIGRAEKVRDRLNVLINDPRNTFFQEFRMKGLLQKADRTIGRLENLLELTF